MKNSSKPSRHLLSLGLLGLTLTLTLSACMENTLGKLPAPLTNAATPDSHTAIAQLEGSIGSGPVANATITVNDHNGTPLKTVLGDDKGHYAFRARFDASAFPLILKAEGGLDLVTLERSGLTLMAAATASAATGQANITPYSTLITKLAQRLMGGISEANLKRASQIVTAELNLGLYGPLKADPVTTPINATNIHIMLKCSKSLGELIDRTQRSLAKAGDQTTANDIVDALVSDLTDGRLDGLGNRGTQAKISALAQLIAGQIALEALTNNLKIKGHTATAAMDTTIATLFPHGQSKTKDVFISADLIHQAIASITVANQIIPSPYLEMLTTKLSTLPPYSQPKRIKRELPADASNYLTEVIHYVARASEDEIRYINLLASSAHARPETPVSS